MAIVYFLPIEVEHRCFQSKLLLTLKMLSSSTKINVVIGYDKYINAILEFINFPSILLDKSCSNLMYHSRIKPVLKNGGKVAVIDEEGVNNITNNYDGLKSRFDPRSASEINKFFAWGKYDYSLAADAGISKDRIVITGNPRCDLLNEDGLKFYNNKASALNELFGSFILVNDNFVVERFNPDYAPPAREHLSKDQNEELQLLRSRKLKANILQRHKLFSLIMKLAQKNYDINFVIRPHPMSDPTFIQKTFSRVRNVFVIYKDSIEPWLFSCRAMISCGCTTALQAAIAKKPIYHYSGVQESVKPLSSNLGINLTSSSDLNKYPESMIGTNYSMVGNYILTSDSAAENIARELFNLEEKYMHLNTDDQILISVSSKVVEQTPLPLEPKWTRKGYSVANIREMIQDFSISHSISCGNISIKKISPHLFILSNDI